MPLMQSSRRPRTERLGVASAGLDDSSLRDTPHRGVVGFLYGKDGLEAGGGRTGTAPEDRHARRVTE